MRDILFRGKRQDNGEWIEGCLLRIYERVCRGVYQPSEYAIQSAEEWIAPPFVVAETVGEYTGLTDKNGKRIFEGDIIVPTVPSNIPPYEVVFDVTEGQIVLRDCCGDYHGTLANFGRITDNHYKVVGNRWDNPELWRWRNEIQQTD